MRLRECILLAEAGQTRRVDRENGTIEGVKCLGWRSANGREYLKEGVNPSLYEGKPVCVDHVTNGKARSAKETVGWLEGCVKEATGIFARRLRLLNPKGEFEQKLMTAAVDAPHLYGLSHVARGRERPGSGGSIIEQVVEVSGVDIVKDPATTNGLYESVGGGLVPWFTPDLETRLHRIARLQQIGARDRHLAENLEKHMDGPVNAQSGIVSTTSRETQQMTALRRAINTILDGRADLDDVIKQLRDLLADPEQCMGQAEARAEGTYVGGLVEGRRSVLVREGAGRGAVKVPAKLDGEGLARWLQGGR